MNSKCLHHRFCKENSIITNLLVYETAENIIKEDVKSAPGEEELILGERICPLVDKVIEENSSPGFNLNLIYPEARNKLIKQLEEKAEAERENYRLKLRNIQLKKMAVKDKLTKLYNRHYLEPRLHDEIMHANRNSMHVSVLLLDIDHFKYVNDGEGLGHTIGDDALIIMAEIMKEVVRNSDIPGRLGGEEFLVILPDTNEKGAMEISEKLRKEVEGELKKRLINKYPTLAKFIERIDGTISTGITTYDGIQEKEGKINIKECIENADIAMYYSKLTGRNKSTAHKPGMKDEVLRLKRKETMEAAIKRPTGEKVGEIGS